MKRICWLCGSILEPYQSLNGTTGKVYEIFACTDCGLAITEFPDDTDKYEKQDFNGQFNFKDIKSLPRQWRKSVELQISQVNKYLKNGSTILEIGCGAGLTLNELGKNGYKAKGIEPSKSAALTAKDNGLEVTNGYFPIRNDIQKYDGVLLCQVMEHVENLDRFLKEIRKHTNKNGLLFLTQTNYLGLIPSLFKSRWYAWVPEQHFWHFTEMSIEKLLNKYGYKLVEIRYSTLDYSNSPLSLITELIPRWCDQIHVVARRNDKS